MEAAQSVGKGVYPWLRHSSPPAPPPAPPGPTANARKYAWPEKPVVISSRAKRLDGPDKVSGRAKYSFDINRPGMIFGKIVRSPHPHARIVAVDLAEARRAPGVKAALVWKEPGAQVMYQGDPVAAIAADTEEQAIDAARLVKVTYEVMSHVANVEQAMAADAPKIFESLQGVTGNQRRGNVDETGDLEAGFKAAAHVVEQTYQTHVITHVCMESHGCVCEWDGDKLTAWVSTQGVHGTKDGFASGLKIPAANVRVITQYMGGGFGSKFGPDSQGLICARLAQEAKVPVKLFLDRKEEHLDTGNRPSAHAKIKAGVSADGKLTAFDAHELGHGRRRRGVRLPAAVHLPVPEPPSRPHRRLHQRGPAARDARAGPSAGMLPHRNPDGRARRSRPHGSGRSSASRICRRRRPAARGATTSSRARRRSAGRSVTPPATRSPGRSRTASACRRTSGAAAAAAAARTATSRRTAAS